MMSDCIEVNWEVSEYGTTRIKKDDLLGCKTLEQGIEMVKDVINQVIRRDVFVELENYDEVVRFIHENIADREFKSE